MYKIDLHTHSVQSPDGSLRQTDYQSILDRGLLDVIAVTDHNNIAYAQKLHTELGDKIIVGEEITAREGEIIGLYLKEVIPAGLSAAETTDRIHKQGGIVYVPHPFETVRKGLPLAALEGISDAVDIVETQNGRAIQNKSTKATDWAKLYQLPGAASSDAHGKYGWGRTYSVVDEVPTRENLIEQLIKATYFTGSPGLMGKLYPKFNRIRKMLGLCHV
jgi:hypothetical protein